MKKPSRQQLIGMAMAAIFLLALSSLVLIKQVRLLPHLFQTVPKTLEVTATALTKKDKPFQIERTGLLQSSTSVPVNTPASGKILEVYVKEGESVKAGQALFKMDAVAAAAPSVPVADTPKSASAPAAPPASYEKALEEFTRYQKLFEIGAISKRQLEAAAARLQAAKEGGSPAVPGTSAARTVAPPVVSGPVTISAPTSGQVTGLSIASGKGVQAGQPSLFLGSGQELEAVMEVTQEDLYLIHLGSPVALETAPTPIPGQIAAIYPKVAAEQPTTFLAHVKLSAKPPASLTAGLPVKLYIVTEAALPVPAVPTAAILRDGQGKSFIYLIEEGMAQLQEIIPGETLGDYTEVRSQLPEQCQIITSQLEQIKNGDKLTVVP